MIDMRKKLHIIKDVIDDFDDKEIINETE